MVSGLSYNTPVHRTCHWGGALAGALVASVAAKALFFISQTSQTQTLTHHTAQEISFHKRCMHRLAVGVSLAMLAAGVSLIAYACFQAYWETRFENALPFCFLSQELQGKPVSFWDKMIETLHPREADLAKKVGIEALGFHCSPVKELFLYLSADADHNGALNLSQIKVELLRKLAQEYDLKYKVIYRPEDICTQMALARKVGKVAAMIIETHATPHKLILSKGGEVTFDGIPSSCFDGFASDAVVILEGCRAGADPRGIAYQIANLARRPVFASLEKTDDANIIFKKLKPLDVEFFNTTNPGQAVTTQFLPDA